ncbi:MAG: tRNA methyltransferase [Alphaproteobacteria bacterium]|nr:tRNA methyltransferase [Alphaproteobacteria bacterium]
MRLTLFQPDIPQNTGAILRLGACLNTPVDIIGPCGFVWDNRQLKRVGMDYINSVEVTHYLSWQKYYDHYEESETRLLLLTTRGSQSYNNIVYRKTDRILLGQESLGVPDFVHNVATVRIFIPMMKGVRSLNVALAASIVLSEGLRQTNTLPQNN